MVRVNLRMHQQSSRSDVTVGHMEKSVVEVGVEEQLVQMVAVGIGDEYLAIFLAGHKVHDTSHTLCIEFVEDVVKQE